MHEKQLLDSLPDLLERLGNSFDVEFPVSGRSLAQHLERVISEALTEQVPAWGEPGGRLRLDRITDGALTFLYRPHLFPGMDDALRLGHLAQFQSLPRRLPAKAPVAVAAMLESYCHLSGDLFGWRETEDGGFLLWLVDASGHGVRAGFASLVLRLLLDETDLRRPLPELLGILEQRFLAARNASDRRPLYATGLFLRFAPGGSLSFLSAGHPPVLVRAVDGSLRELGPTCRPIGLLPPMNAEAHEVQLEPDDVALLYTDGLLEAGDVESRPFGAERLERALRDAGGGLPQIAAAIYGAVAQHHDLTRLDDDLTFLLLQHRPGDTTFSEEVPQ